MTRAAAGFGVALVLALALASPAAAADPDAGLDDAERGRLNEADEAFRYQDYERTIALLRPLLDSGHIQDPGELRRAREHLGASYWFADAKDAARLVFSLLLKDRPDYRLDPLYYPPELIRFFEDEKQRLTDAGLIGDTGPDTVLRGPRRTLVTTVTERRLPAIAYLMPFGVGQFANGDRSKGAAVAVLQGIGLALNVGTWLGVEALKRGKTNSIAAADEGRAQLLRALWWAGTGMATASWIYSVADGFANRPPRTKVEQRWELVDPEDLPTPRESSRTLRPTTGPTALGLGLSGDF